MKKLLSASIAAATIAGFAAPAAAVEGLSANAGMVSDYYYRGGYLGDAGAYAGVDYENSGFYAGVWAIDDGLGGNNGLEYDVYLGYGMESVDFSWAVGVTTYQYTYDGELGASDEETEFNLGLGFSGFALDVAVGTATDGSNVKDVENDYTFVSLGWSGEVFGAVIGMYDQDESEKNADDEYDYTYVEVSAGGELATMDVGVTLGRIIDSSEFADISTSGSEGSSDYYLVLDVSKSFDL
jgi:uncharacterized protein (TIGR02001 family)